MRTEEEKLICDYMSKFAKENWDQMKDVIEDWYVGFTSKTEFFRSVKSDIEDAMWLLDEVCIDNIGKLCLDKLLVYRDDENTFRVIKIKDKHIKVEYNNGYQVNFCSPKTKTVTYYE